MSLFHCKHFSLSVVSDTAGQSIERKVHCALTCSSAKLYSSYLGAEPSECTQRPVLIHPPLSSFHLFSFMD